MRQPAKIILATDLSPRCDRATERAIALAKQWGADLHLVTVHEPGLPRDHDKKDNAAIARTRTRALESLRGFDAVVTVLEGRSEEQVAALAEGLSADLIVTGPPTGRLLAGSTLGGTIAALMKDSRAAVLVVRRPADRPYRRVIAALDLSDASRTTVEAAQTIFCREQPLVVFHAFSTPYRMFSGDVEAYEAGIREGVSGELRDALKAWAVPDAANIPIITEYGDPATQVRAIAEKSDIDLVITGTHGRRGIVALLLGSVAEDIIRTAPCDVLAVPVDFGKA